MIQMYTFIDVADNTGAKECMCIKVLGGSRRRYAGLGDIIVASAKKPIPGGEVTPGDDAGNTQTPTVGKVLRVLPDQNKVVVEGINRVYRHLKPSRRNPQGGRLSKEMPVSVSNVLLYCSTCRRGRRIGKRYNN